MHDQLDLELDFLQDMTPFGKLCNVEEFRIVNFESQYFFGFKTNFEPKRRKQVLKNEIHNFAHWTASDIYTKNLSWHINYLLFALNSHCHFQVLVVREKHLLIDLIIEMKNPERKAMTWKICLKVMDRETKN